MKILFKIYWKSLIYNILFRRYYTWKYRNHPWKDYLSFKRPWNSWQVNKLIKEIDKLIKNMPSQPPIKDKR